MYMCLVPIFISLCLLVCILFSPNNNNNHRFVIYIYVFQNHIKTWGKICKGNAKLVESKVEVMITWRFPLWTFRCEKAKPELSWDDNFCVCVSWNPKFISIHFIFLSNFFFVHFFFVIRTHFHNSLNVCAFFISNQNNFNSLHFLFLSHFSLFLFWLNFYLGSSRGIFHL